jgi:predicted MFS family arabinose efflux permease
MTLNSILAQALAPTLGTAISESFDNRAAFVLAGLLLVAAIIMGFFMRLPETLRERKKAPLRPVHLADYVCLPALPFVIINLIFSFAHGSNTAFIVLAGAEKGITLATVYFITFATVTFIVRPIAGRIGDRRGAPAIIFPAILFACAAELMLASMNSVWTIALAGVGMALGYGAAAPVLQSECIRRAQNGRTGVASSTYYMGPDLGNFIGPALSGFVIYSIGYSNTFLFNGGIVALAAVIYVIFLRSLKKRPLEL